MKENKQIIFLFLCIVLQKNFKNKEDIVKKLMLLLVMLALAGFGCASTLDIGASNVDSSGDTLLVVYHGSNKPVDVGRTYNLINTSNANYDLTEAQAEWIKTYAKVIKGNPELLLRQQGYRTGFFPTLQVTPPSIHSGLYNGMIWNESQWTLIFEMPSIGYRSPPIPPDEPADNIEVPEGEFTVYAYRTYNGQFYKKKQFPVNARRGDQKYKGKRRDWFTTIW